MFPDEETARLWFEVQIWPDGPVCPKCGAQDRVKATPNQKPLPYWCGDCRRHFSVRMGTALERSRVPLRKWVIAIYLCLTSLKSVSSMKLHQDIGVTQRTAWFMLHRIRESWTADRENQMAGPVEVDETYVGGLDRNRHFRDRKGVATAGGKVPVVGAKGRATNQVRAEVIVETDRLTLRGFVQKHVETGATLYTDEAAAYQGRWGYHHAAVKHSAGEYVRGMASTNGMELFWAMLKRAHKGTFHRLSPKHLQRYVDESAGKHNFRDSGTVSQMRDTAAGLIGRRLLYRDLIRDNGLPSCAFGDRFRPPTLP